MRQYAAIFILVFLAVTIALVLVPPVGKFPSATN